MDFGAEKSTGARRLLAEAGYEEIEVEPTRIFRAEDARAFLKEAGTPVAPPSGAWVAESARELV
jgi:hypothetical protein